MDDLERRLLELGRRHGWSMASVAEALALIDELHEVGDSVFGLRAEPEPSSLAAQVRSSARSTEPRLLPESALADHPDTTPVMAAPPERLHDPDTVPPFHDLDEVSDDTATSLDMLVLDHPVLDIDRFEDRGLIAHGGQGEVRRVYDRRLERLIAVKILTASDSPIARARFEQEATLTAQLEHPGIVPIYDRGTTPDGRPWFAMKFVEGRPLSEIIAEHHLGHRIGGGATPWTQRRLLELFARIAEATAFAHSRGVVHRDLKPGHVLVGDFGEAVIIDWGLSRRNGQASPPTEALTMPGSVLGSPVYMAPEQARGDVQLVGTHTDVYGLGSILYEMLTGRAPHAGRPMRVVVAVAYKPPPLPDQGPTALKEICARAMAFDPSDRYPDAARLTAAVRGWLDGDG